jgi:NAD(P)-dependent dehydrogenase (short-subunit alcohol dehydrogenase family)
MAQHLLITGSSGIAAATARLACQQGDRVSIIGKNERECADLANELGGATFAIARVEDPARVNAAVRRCLEEAGPVDGAFNAAGLSGRPAGDGPLHECSDEAWSLMMKVHAAGTFHVCRALLGQWMQSKHPGAIVNMGSVLARSPQRDYFATIAYAASKGAIESMTISAAAYYAPFGIRINVIAPGLVRTPMSGRAQADPTILAFMEKKQPLTKNLIDADHIARVALFLLSGHASTITGEVIRADGGWSVSG